MKKIKITCPAKINLSLEVLGKRQDGFHNIKSIMQTISLFDYLTISTSDFNRYEINLSGTSSEIPYDEKNLVHKAIRLFIEATNIPACKTEVFIEKNIPVSAGLAGGSTDAAGVIFGLNELFGGILSEKKLHEMCASLGSDLNFCLAGGKQMTNGRGEILTPMEFEEFNVSLIKPKNLGISAKEAYTKFSDLIKTADKEKLQTRQNYVNDLEWALIDDYEELKNIKKLYPQAVMSGSGSVFYIKDNTFSAVKNCEIINNLKSIPYGVRISQ